MMGRACFKCDMLQRDCKQLLKDHGHAHCLMLGEQQACPNLAESGD